MKHRCASSACLGRIGDVNALGICQRCLYGQYEDDFGRMSSKDFEDWLGEALGPRYRKEN